jgi:hypothetical protein
MTTWNRKLIAEGPFGEEQQIDEIVFSMHHSGSSQGVRKLAVKLFILLA